MSSDEQKKSTQARNLGASGKSNDGNLHRSSGACDNSNVGEINHRPLLRTQKSRESNELHEFNESFRNSLQRKIKDQDVGILREIQDRYEIHPEMAEHLPKLRDFEIVVVIDDSGSMDTKVDNSEQTRWSELCEIVKIVIEIVIKFQSRGIDIHFISGETFLKVKDSKFVEELFNRIPRDYTPLVATLEKIFTSRLARRGRDKKLLVFVATDGEPTNEDGDPIVDEFKRLMTEKRDVETTYISFLLCTDDPDCVGYLRKWDRIMKNVDVTDDYQTEKEEIRRCRQDENYPFSYGDYIVKALVGAIIQKIDRLDESDTEDN